MRPPSPERGSHMYRFDDKWRRRLLEDALVADLLAGTSVEGSAPPQAEMSGRVPVTRAAATRAGGFSSHKP
jgi:hypothetical protein